MQLDPLVLIEATVVSIHTDSPIPYLLILPPYTSEPIPGFEAFLASSRSNLLRISFLNTPIPAGIEIGKKYLFRCTARANVYRSRSGKEIPVINYSFFDFRAIRDSVKAS